MKYSMIYSENYYRWNRLRGRVSLELKITTSEKYSQKNYIKEKKTLFAEVPSFFFYFFFRMLKVIVEAKEKFLKHQSPCYQLFFLLLIDAEENHKIFKSDWTSLLLFMDREEAQAKGKIQELLILSLILFQWKQTKKILTSSLAIEIYHRYKVINIITPSN